jgi:hypothetical protein
MRHRKFSTQSKLTTTSFWYTVLRNGQSDPNVLQATRCSHLPVSTGLSGPTDPCKILHWRETSPLRRTESSPIWTRNTKQRLQIIKFSLFPPKTQNNTTSELNGNGYFEISFSLNTVRMRRASRWRSQFKHSWQNRITLLNCCPVIQQLLMLISKIVQCI